MKFLFLLAFILGLTSASTTNSLTEVRTLFKSALFDNQACTKLIYSFKNQANSNPVFTAYKASGLMMNAKHVGNPLDKLSTFSKGKSLLEQTVSKEPTNVEIRFLRLTMQANAPSFLGYSEAIPRDKKFILQNIKNETDEELKTMIVSYLKKSEIITQAEKNLL